jgi:quercetin dioxygenase-like cupin family protein
VGDSFKPGQVATLGALIEYQAGAVVSRTVIDRKTGTVTLFAFDAEEGLSEHTAPFDAMVYLLDGAAEITISGKPFELKAGDMIVMPADEPHALKAVEKFKMLLIMVRS